MRRLPSSGVYLVLENSPLYLFLNVSFIVEMPQNVMNKPAYFPRFLGNSENVEITFMPQTPDL